MLEALDHVIIAVRDLDAAARDYSRLLGLAPSWQGSHPGWGSSNVLFRLDNMYVELLASTGEGPIGHAIASRIKRVGEGLQGLVFATHDIDACVAGLQARGLPIGPAEPGHGRDSNTGAERQWRRATIPIESTRGVVIFPIQHDSPADALPLARPEGDPAAAIHALDHVVVQSTDADATRALYRDALGLRLAVDKEFPDWGVRLMFFRIGGITVEVAAALHGADTKAVLPEARATATEDRPYGMSYRVRNLEAAHARLSHSGVEVSEIRTGRRPGTRVFTVRSGTCGVPTLVIEFEAEVGVRPTSRETSSGEI